MKTWAPVIIQTIILFSLLFGWCIRIETAIAKITTEIQWIKQEIK